jgi:hypothetical protein
VVPPQADQLQHSKSNPISDSMICIKTADHRQLTFFKEVIVCQAGNAQIAGTPLKPILTPTSVHHAKKNVNFSIIPAIPRIALTKVRITESVNPRPDFTVEHKLGNSVNVV